ncbi:DUF6285 domain-containing protein [Janthinobacterium sp. 17J80-10]|uniref:DUF6285 domain-containing protein n=1 Tax=Janthinobacterium sp. 17J80-10 TaxID=2497863 RepID=UPI0010054EC8|nr:DUF6285 domain-containing protein [Janthinobacterium sp. 17J80-10]QAU34138.1 hypothetical protein EKL02_08025 [Janthinobacterium sp. 17J80-10]
MSDRPDGQDLLRTAREELMKRLLPALPADLRYQALMIANAMAIAARELDAGAAGQLQELAGQRALLQDAESEAPGNPEQLRQSLTSGRKRLGAAIRLGEFDADKPAHQALLRHLASSARDKVAIYNPKLLSSGDAR